MSRPVRTTAVVSGRLKSRELKLDAARHKKAGRQVLTFETLACRLAGGFTRPIEDVALRTALQDALPSTELGELEPIKLLPGMVDACVTTLRKVWAARIDLAAEGPHPRLTSLSALESAVLSRLPSGMKRPGEIVDAALTRLKHAPEVLGTVELHGISELEPCWRPLLGQLATVTSVTWIAASRDIPQWLPDTQVHVIPFTEKTPQVETVSAASAIHECIEALRWARALIAAEVPPNEIAIASASTSEFDDHFLALRADANLDIHFVHGTKITASRDGQAAAALADILLRGLTQRRLRRLVALANSPGAPFAEFPNTWLSILPKNAPLSSQQSWDKLFARLRPDNWPGGVDHTVQFREIITLLQGGTSSAVEAGQALLRGKALGIWKKALGAGPAASLDLTLQNMREDDGLDACVSTVWLPASQLAGSPRRFARLIGLNSSRWPRRASEDRLLSEHIVSSERLQPLSVVEADRRDFETILSTTADSVVISFSRRDGDGRLLGLSTLLHGRPPAAYLRRNRMPEHALSESDRLAARPTDFNTTLQARSAAACWSNWWSPAVTRNDGQVRPGHPAVLAALGRSQSSSSLTLLLRHPLGFVWKYAMGLSAPDLSDEPLVLSRLESGNLVHEVLDEALKFINRQADPSSASTQQAIGAAIATVRGRWESLNPIPPEFIWNRTLQEAASMADVAMSFRPPSTVPTLRSYSEVPFGATVPVEASSLPWDPQQEVLIPGTQLRINGFIDRLDINQNNSEAMVIDYKTGKPVRGGIELNGGRELQRCLYAFAVKALIGDGISVAPSLLYLRNGSHLQLPNPEETLEQLQSYLGHATAGLTAGTALAGIDAASEYDDLAFALPANAAASYCKRKQLSIVEALGQATEVWEAL